MLLENAKEVTFALEHKGWIWDDWSAVLWSGEKIVARFNSEGHLCVSKV